MQPHPDDAKRIWNNWWRISNLYWIQTKKAKKQVFRPNWVQRQIIKYLRYWHLLLILKARQEGVSTFFLIYHLDKVLFTPNTTRCILAHRRDSLQKLFRIIKIAYESCPDAIQLADGTIWKKPKAKYDTKNELYFEGLDSRIYVALEVRSDTLHGLHVSEWAHIKNADEVLTATLAAVVEGGEITGETTANGEGDSFHEEWENEESPFIKLFFGYQDHPDYCDPIEDEAKFRATLTPDEEKLLSVRNMKLGNIAWRRRILSMPARRKKFKQEFPCTPEEAFLTSGKSPFDREKINDWIIRNPIASKMEGRLNYWIMPQDGKRYILAGDCASGMGEEKLDNDGSAEGGTDYSTIGVFDCETLQLCALFRAKWPYAKLHHIVRDLAMEYNMAYVAIEATDHGLTVLNNLVENVNIDGMPYPHTLIHTTKRVDSRSKEETMKWGFYTNAQSKPLIVDHMAELIDEHEIKIYSKVAQREFKRFIINDKGQYAAKEGFKDDIVMMSCIAAYLVPFALKVGRMTASKKELGLS